MKKWLGLSIIAIVALSLASCSKKKNVNPGGGITGIINNCPIGSLVTPQGQIIQQGNCPNGQGLLNNQCVPATPCNSMTNPLGGAAYLEALGVQSKSVFENLMADVFGFCQKDLAWGTAACTSYSDHLELFIDQAPTGIPNSNMVMVTIYAGYARQPMTFQMGYWPINNSQGFELRTGVPFRVVAEQGQFGQDRISVKLLFHNQQFASGFVSRVR